MQHPLLYYDVSCGNRGYPYVYMAVYFHGTSYGTLVFITVPSWLLLYSYGVILYSIRKPCQLLEFKCNSMYIVICMALATYSWFCEIINITSSKSFKIKYSQSNKIWSASAWYYISDYFPVIWLLCTQFNTAFIQICILCKLPFKSYVHAVQSNGRLWSNHHDPTIFLFNPISHLYEVAST